MTAARADRTRPICDEERGVAWAFADAFWWVLGFCVVALLGVTRLPRRSTRQHTAQEQRRRETRS